MCIFLVSCAFHKLQNKNYLLAKLLKEEILHWLWQITVIILTLLCSEAIFHISPRFSSSSSSVTFLHDQLPLSTGWDDPTNNERLSKRIQTLYWQTTVIILIILCSDLRCYLIYVIVHFVLVFVNECPWVGSMR